MKNILVDANIFLEFFLGQEKADLCGELLKMFDRGEYNGFVSTFTVDSVLLGMFRNKTTFQQMRDFLRGVLQSKGFQMYEPTFKDRFGALDLMKKQGLDYEDALTLQAALSCGCKQILSFDIHFDGVKGVERVEGFSEKS
ncbi:hypothetical protein CMI48_01615 [Candidatus Pacearchaeota archaeon]|nr:hypothetical protein [Candidatus Pacearchaeota archaeon]